MPEIPPPSPPSVNVSKRAELVHGNDTVYPPAAKAFGLEGTVVLSGVIGVDGRVHDIKLVRSVHKVLDNAAIEAWKKYVYTPAHRNGVLVEEAITKSFDFNMR